MSRYSIPAQQPGLTVIVGWDNPLTTFFAQVFDPSIEEDAAACLLWIGTTPEAIPTVVGHCRYATAIRGHSTGS
jgi:hypothetical protein